MPRKARIISGCLLLALLLVCAPGQALAGTRRSLLAIYDTARHHDPKLAFARAEYRAQQERFPQARAKLLPQLSLKGSGERTLERITNLPGQVTPIDQNYNRGQFSVEMSQPLIKPTAWYQLSQAHHQARAAHWKLESAEQALMVRATKLYVSALKRQRELGTDQMVVRADQQRLQQVKGELQGGIASLLDVNQVRGELANDRVKVVRARGSLRSAKAKLEALTGLAVNQLAPLGKIDAWLEAPLRPLDRVVAELTRKNTEVLAAAAQVRAAEARLSSTEAAHWPQLSLNARYQKASTQQPLAIGSSLPAAYHTSTATISLNLSMTLYSGGSTWSRQRQAQAQADKQRQDYRQAFQRAVRTVRLEYQALLTDRQSLAASNQAVRAEHTAYQAAQMGYRDGTRNIVDVIQAQQAWFEARQSQIESRYQALIDWVKLRHASGALSRASLVHINHWLKTTG